MDDDELQNQVANAMDDEQEFDSNADENTDFQESGDQEEGHDGEGSDDDQGNEGQGNGQGSQGNGSDDDLDDDDDDDLDNFMPPALQGAGQDQGLPQNFDIRTLRDENGSIDPQKANEAIQQYAQQYAQQMVNRFANANQTEAQTAQQLEGQWHKGIKKYPGVAKNKTLARLARDIHLNSITAMKNGTGPYLSPIAAMRKVSKMQGKIAGQGAKNERTRRTVVKTGQHESGSGKGGSKPTDAYSKARLMAQSSDPNVAKQGRMKIMELRRQAREK